MMPWMASWCLQASGCIRPQVARTWRACSPRWPRRSGRQRTGSSVLAGRLPSATRSIAARGSTGRTPRRVSRVFWAQAEEERDIALRVQIAMADGAKRSAESAEARAQALAKENARLRAALEEIAGKQARDPGQWGGGGGPRAPGLRPAGPRHPEGGAVAMPISTDSEELRARILACAAVRHHTRCTTPKGANPLDSPRSRA